MNPKLSTTGLHTAQQELTCPLCGNAGITTSWNPHAFNYGSGESMVELTVDVPVRQCEACDFKYLDDEAERLKHEAVCRHLGVLPPGEILRIRKRFGMTQSEFARVSGLGVASLNRWENGLTIQTHGYDRYLRLLETHPSYIRKIEKFANLIPSQQSETLTRKQFRVLNVTTNLRKEQENFQLHKAA